MKKLNVKNVVISAVVVILIVIGLGFSFGQQNKNKAYQNERHEILMESKKISEQKNATELPQVYQEKVLKSLKAFTDNHKLSEDDKMTLENLVYENIEQYQELWFDIH